MTDFTQERLSDLDAVLRRQRRLNEVVRAHINRGDSSYNIVIVLRLGLHTLLQQVVADLPRYGVASTTLRK